MASANVLVDKNGFTRKFVVSGPGALDRCVGIFFFFWAFFLLEHTHTYILSSKNVVPHPTKIWDDSACGACFSPTHHTGTRSYPWLAFAFLEPETNGTCPNQTRNHQVNLLSDDLHFPRKFFLICLIRAGLFSVNYYECFYKHHNLSSCAALKCAGRNSKITSRGFTTSPSSSPHSRSRVDVGEEGEEM